MKFDIQHTEGWSNGYKQFFIESFKENLLNIFTGNLLYESCPFPLDTRPANKNGSFFMCSEPSKLDQKPIWRVLS